jgi:CHAD domain
VVQLVGQDIDTGRAVKRLRRAGRLLAPLRDADAVIASAQSLCAHERSALSAKTCSALRDLLRREKARLSGVARHDQVKGQAAESLKQVRRSANDWDWKRVRFPVLAAEIRRSYENGRRAMRRASEQDRSDTFHEWRKRVKTLWYALRLLERRLPPLRRQLADLERLETWLGDDHNLLVLLTQVPTSPGLNHAQPDGARVRSLAQRRQRELRRMALAMGARRFKATPKEFDRHLRQMWKSERGKSRDGARPKTVPPSG